MYRIELKPIITAVQKQISVKDLILEQLHKSAIRQQRLLEASDII